MSNNNIPAVRSVFVDLEFAEQFNIKFTEASVYSYILHASSYLERVSIDGKDYVFLSRNLAAKRLKRITSAPDTIYRYYKNLHKQGVIIYAKHEGKDCIHIVPEVAAQWNSDKLPRLGQTSENTRTNVRISSDKRPTYNEKNIIVERIEKKENAPAKFLTEEEINKLDSRNEYTPPSSAPPPQAERASDEDPYLKIENETVAWLENDFAGQSKWRVIERTTGANPNELDRRQVVQAALSVCGDYVLSNPRIIRNKLLGCATTQLNIQRKPKPNARRNNQATIKPIQKQSNAEYYDAKRSWGC